MMRLNSRTGIILKSGGLALLWVLIVTYTTFPGLVRDTASFLSEQTGFENTGKYLLFGLGIYAFDLLAQILYSTDHVSTNLLVAASIAAVVLSVLIIPVAIDTEMNRICPILLIGISMGCLKALNFYFNDVASHYKRVQILKLSI
jgi:hypothetical protein